MKRTFLLFCFLFSLDSVTCQDNDSILEGVLRRAEISMLFWYFHERQKKNAAVK